MLESLQQPLGAEAGGNQKQVTLPPCPGSTASPPGSAQVEARSLTMFYLPAGSGKMGSGKSPNKRPKVRAFRVGVKEEEQKHKLWGQKGLFLLTKPRSK